LRDRILQLLFLIRRGLPSARSTNQLSRLDVSGTPTDAGTANYIRGFLDCCASIPRETGRFSPRPGLASRIRACAEQGGANGMATFCLGFEPTHSHYKVVRVR
jgi:hypothetical protein